METISQISKMFDVSTRTLRYYEEVGLITSSRIPDYAYRVYSKDQVDRLKFILLMRKLNISLADIKKALLSSEPSELVQVLEKKLEEVGDQILSFSELETILRDMIDMIKSKEIKDANLIEDKIGMIEDDLINQVMESTQLMSKKLKEKQTMKNDERKVKTGELKDVRIIHIPSFTVASSHCPQGENPEEVAGKNLEDFILTKKLWEVKGDFRVFGFNNPNPDASGDHGYEFYVTIPEDMEVEAPMVKKTFQGGLYAAHGIKMGDFHEWQDFAAWLQVSEDYDYERREPLGMEGSLEEHLNAYNYYKNDEKEFVHLDLLIPVKKR